MFRQTNKPNLYLQYLQLILANIIDFHDLLIENEVSSHLKLCKFHPQ